MQELLENDGVVILHDDEEKKRLKGVVLPVFLACWDDICEADDLALFYTYRMEDQAPGSFVAMSDGYSTIKVNAETGVSLSAVGVSVEAMDKGLDYAVLVLLHELCHLLVREPPAKDQMEHSEAFHARLDGLLAKFNFVFGLDIQNDYFGLASERPQEGAESVLTV